VVETPQANLGGRDEMAFGHLYGRFKPAPQTLWHLFSGRYKSLIVDGSGKCICGRSANYVQPESGTGKVARSDKSSKAFGWSSSS